MNKMLRTLPAIDELLREPRVRQWLDHHPRSLVLDAIRAALDQRRKAILLHDTASAPEPNEQIKSYSKILDAAEVILAERAKLKMRRVINATGVVIHTNLGRSILSEKAIQHLTDICRGYSNLEYDIRKGERGNREAHIEEILKRLTGAEAALAVNNNAAAVLLTLDSLAHGKDVIVSRGELVEIGGSFRLPDVMQQSGAILHEVGTTNKTRLNDYKNAITDQTGLILKVHTSNYKIIGFTSEVHITELAKLGSEHGIPVVWDLGSGSLVDLAAYGVGKEPTVQEAIESEADIITFSGDKLLGGPQAGIIIGKKKHIERIKANPLMRALRMDKLTLAALEATLHQYLDREKAIKDIPTLNMLTQPLNEIGRKADLLLSGIRNQASGITATIQDDTSQSGGGTLPLGNFPTKTVCIWHKTMNAQELESQLRLNDPSIITRIKEGMVVLDPRTLNEEEIGVIIKKIINLTTDIH
ncbi:MAG: L-seryl-tRNA(Sec) selenium transferase [Nitrospirota bacterium]